MVKAIIFEEFGGPEVLQLIENYELPNAEPDEVVVKVHSTSVNPVDAKIRSKEWGKAYGTNFPRVPGGDVAGVVTEDGKIWKKGDRIVALTDRFLSPKKDGSYAELALVKEEWAAPAPKNLSLETEAAAIPLVSLTALQALETADLKPGSRVLVHAAAGGVGNYAVQLAKILYGAYVVGTSGPANLEFVKGLGADEVVNYREQDFAEVFKDPSNHFDAIVDVIGGETEEKSYGILKPGGTFAHILNSGTSQDRIAAAKEWKDKKYTNTLVKPNGAQLKKIVDLVDSGKLVVPIHKVWPLEQAADANREVENGHSRGKNVLQIVQ